MFKKSLVALTLVISTVSFAMDKNNPFHKTFEKQAEKTNDLYEKHVPKYEAQKDSNGDTFFTNKNGTYSESHVRKEESQRREDSYQLATAVNNIKRSSKEEPCILN